MLVKLIEACDLIKYGFSFSKDPRVVSFCWALFLKGFIFNVTFLSQVHCCRCPLSLAVCPVFVLRFHVFILHTGILGPVLFFCLFCCCWSTILTVNQLNIHIGSLGFHVSSAVVWTPHHWFMFLMISFLPFEITLWLVFLHLEMDALLSSHRWVYDLFSHALWTWIYI